MNAQEITAMTYQKNDVLVRPGKRAVVVEPAIHRVSKKFIGYTVELFTDGKPLPQKCTLFVADLRDNWTLKPVTEAAPVEEQGASFPIGQFFEMTNGVPTVLPVVTDPDLTATAARIQQLQKDLADANSLIESLESRIEKLADSRDSAIDDLAAAAEVKQDERDGELEAALGEIKRLTEALAEARAASAPVLNAASTDVLTPRKQEVCVMRDAAQHHIAEKLNDDWQILHLQFMPAYDEENAALNVVFTRVITAPQPRRAVTAVGPTITIQPVESIRPSMSDRLRDEMEDVLGEGQRVYNEALAASPIAIRPLSLLPVVNHD